eukprot:TRINITY_DN7718_c0_g1_i7.p1 TRINITY_DN7718_c0_g1~~TRINITY_DN7718_c0_g1_i7.p1  ORF type:complete len:111 (+),score=33.56 TRINITY_DN7718_c0_g1_i7:233-565(+)
MTVPAGSSLEEVIEAHKFPKAPEIPGIRTFTEKDISQVAALFQEYMKKFKIHPVFSEETLKQMLTPDEKSRFTYIVEDNGSITDFISFYLVPYTVPVSYTHLTLPTNREV